MNESVSGTNRTNRLAMMFVDGVSRKSSAAW
jgi:hypothetical protein